MGEKIFTMALAMVVSIFVARYLEPERFGILSYAISLSSFFGIATHMGLNGLAIRELVKKPEDQNTIMGTVFSIKFAMALLALLAFLIFIFTTETENQDELYVLLIVSGTIILKPLEVFDFWFQAKVKAKYSSIVGFTSTVISAIIKVTLIVVGANLIAFATTTLFQSLLIVCLFAYYFNKISDLPFKLWKFNFSTAKELLGQSWMIMLGAIFTIIYLKIDQIMIRWLLTLEDVGVYAVASKLSESWYFIPSIIVSSLFPKLLELKKNSEEQFYSRLQQLFDFLFCIAFVIALVITFISKPFITFLYGKEYIDAAFILSIHIWAGIFIFMRAVFSKWILVEDAIIFSTITQGSGAVINIILNLFLIPLYGTKGAAVATILSYAMASYFSLYFFKKSRPIFWLMTKSLFFPLRFPLKYIKKNNEN